ncbi:MAG: hypothetical protein J5486_08075 [Bacteroidaceae bacterium]|nr:hypothetical protein [Bacteroidaceae bacterium]
MTIAVAVFVVVIPLLLWHSYRQERGLKLKDDSIVREVRRNQKLVDYSVSQGLSRSAILDVMSLLAVVFLLIHTSLPAHAQTQPVGMRVEVAEAETDNGEYSIFTYKDSEADDSFSYYLSLGRVTDFLGADEILGMEVQSIHEVTICLGGTTDEALTTIGAILDLYDKDINTTVEFLGRASTSGVKLGEPVTTTCTVVRKTLGGKRLQFLFPEGKRQGRAYLSKSVVKELRTNFKCDIKLHPKQHRK